MNYKSLKDLRQDVLSWLAALDPDTEVVVGIPRSGILVASIIALYRNLLLTDVNGLIESRVLPMGWTKPKARTAESPLRQGRKILVVDDSVSSGTSMLLARQAIEEAKLPHRIQYGAVYVKPGSESLVDTFAVSLPEPRLFEWNLMHSWALPRACVDIDGVLCRDPTQEENDDGSAYLRFVTEVPALVRPSQRIGWLVSCRLEKYRQATEEWLHRNGLKYSHLVMMNLPDMISRQKAASHGRFKAAVYRRTTAIIFIESAESQAREIASICRKPVICIENGQCMHSGEPTPFELSCVSGLQTQRARASSLMARFARRLR